MDKLLENLKEYGADIEGAMGRFLDDVELYQGCLTDVLADNAFPSLGQALEKKDYKSAFEYAHMLKGITGNMGLTPLYSVICSMVEALRKNEYCHLQDDYAEMLDQLNRLEQLQEAVAT